MARLVSKYWLRFNFVVSLVCVTCIITLWVDGSWFKQSLSNALGYSLYLLLAVVILGIVGSAFLMRSESAEDRGGMKVLYSSLGLGALFLVLSYMLIAASWG